MRLAQEQSDTVVCPNAEEGRLRMLYIGGNARCGSTLLGRLMGQVEGFVLVGEPQSMWDRCFRQNRLCGCGRPFRECAFWKDVAERAFGGFDEVDIARIVRTKRRYEQIRSLARLLGSGSDPDIAYYLDCLGRLYRAVGAVSGARVIVDTSKSPLYASSLCRIEGIDLKIVHLVRDSRAVAYSNQRRKANPAIHWQTATFGTTGPVRSAIRWNAQNLLMRRLHAGRPGFTSIRYEDFVADPQSAIDRLCALVGERPPEPPIRSGDTVELGSSHTSSGNPDRFEPRVTIRLDSEWEQKMPRRQKLLVTALTLPLLVRYGYHAGGWR